MRIPQVTGRVRRGPGQALRAVFTGIGQMFLAADRLKEQVESSADSGLREGCLPQFHRLKRAARTNFEQPCLSLVTNPVIPYQ